MKALKFKIVEMTFRTFPKLLNIPTCHSILNSTFAQYQLAVEKGEVA